MNTLGRDTPGKVVRLKKVSHDQRILAGKYLGVFGDGNDLP